LNCGDVCLAACSSAIDQSRGSGVHTAGRGVDSEGDDYEDDQEILDDSETSDDSDPELASPRLIRQTNLSMSQVLCHILSSLCRASDVVHLLTFLQYICHFSCQSVGVMYIKQS